MKAARTLVVAAVLCLASFRGIAGSDGADVPAGSAVSVAEAPASGGSRALPGAGGGESSRIDVGLPLAGEDDGVIRAFPGAEGGGMYVSGGRGGEVYHVTTLADAGPGSLREALSRSNRIVVFDVCGTIRLESPLEIKRGDITIAGQTAPGAGICIRDYPVQIKADNVIVRYLRFRLGDASGREGDALGGRFRTGVIIDHCSMSWSTDECASFYANRNFTMQWCLLSESLRISVHGKGRHGYGGLWGGRNASFHHNLLADHDSRNARLDHPAVYLDRSSGRDYAPTHRGNVDLRNNVVYNWGDNTAYGGEEGRFNFVNNYYKPGPASRKRDYFVEAYRHNAVMSAGSAYPQLYLSGNYHAGDYAAAINADNRAGGVRFHGLSYEEAADFAECLLTRPLPVRSDDSTTCYTTTHSAAEAYDRVLDFAGASLCRDAVDERVVADLRAGRASFAGSRGSTGGLIDSQFDVGGWPELRATDEQIARASADSDRDGIPDSCEELLGLDAGDASDASLRTLDPQGLYTNLEVYLHLLVRRITEAQRAGGLYVALE